MDRVYGTVDVGETRNLLVPPDAKDLGGGWWVSDGSLHWITKSVALPLYYCPRCGKEYKEERE
jgi:hypothetical protein